MSKIKDYFKLDLLGSHIYWFIDTIQTAMEHPDNMTYMVKAGIKYNPDENGHRENDKFTIKIPLELVALLTEAVANSVTNENIQTKIIEGSITYVTESK